ncbi:MAG TPA: AbrB/MazE/SpoVT family DNA-binding domain-containing protein [Thermoplasmata archaeon]
MGDIVRQVDSRGRILIPASRRKKHAIGGKVLLTEKGDVVEILPLDQTDLTVHFDAVEVDVEADLADWHRVRRQLRKG